VDSLDKKNSSDSKYQWIRIAGPCLFIPTFLVLYPVAFFYIGNWLDGKLGTIWLKAVFLFAGIISAFRQTYFVIRDLIKALEKHRDS